MLTRPPEDLAATRESLRALSCYVISPARKARARGRIGLRPTADGFGTPDLGDGWSVAVSGAELVLQPGGRTAPITTLRDAAEFVAVQLTPDPGVGHDLPPYAPDEVLAVDAGASRWLGEWFAFGARQLDRLAADADDVTEVSEAQLWPEHFDLAVTVERGDVGANVGFSPGDATCPDPYVYVGPHDMSGLTEPFWNASFGALLTVDELLATGTPDASAAALIDGGLRRLAAR